VQINQPPLETSHNWRQTFTAMMARNFYDGDMNILRPEIDYSGEKPGVVGAEFPLFSYGIAVISKITAYSHWTGRLLNLIITTFGMYCFYLVLLFFFNKRMAFFASFILIISIWFMFARKIMPDTFSVSLTIIAFYYGIMYLTKGRNLLLLLFFIFGTLGVLSKMPAVIIMSVFIPVVFSSSFVKSRRITLMIVGLLMLVLMSLWYFMYVPHLVRVYGNQLFFTRSFSEGFHDIMQMKAETLKRFYFDAFQGYIGFAVFLAGLIFAFYRKQKKIIGMWLVTGLFLIVYIMKTGFVFATHSYYIIPFVPVMALLAGYLLSEIRKPWIAYMLLGFMTIESVANQQHDFFIKPADKVKLNYEAIADRYISQDALVLTNGGQSTTQLYFINRKGWTVSNSQISDQLVDSLVHKGLDYLFLNTCRENPPQPNFELIYTEECISLYAVN